MVTGKRIKDFGIKAGAGFFFLGYFPLAPGTAGAAGGLLFYLILFLLSPGFIPQSADGAGWEYAVFLALFFLCGVFFSSRGEKLWKKRDSSYIVIDEAFSIFITFFCLPVTVPILAVGFVLNRIFDIYKPWPLRLWERIRGGWGVMLDDLGAGIYSNCALRIVIFCYSILFAGNNN